MMMKKNNDDQIRILPKMKKYSYDDWLDFFRKFPADVLRRNKEHLEQNLPVEGYAALLRWIEIIENPSKMDKLYSARLKASNDENIMEIAVGDDDEAFYEALIRENVQQLNSSTVSTQETARLTQNINIFRKELREIRSRRPKKGTVLEKVLEKAAMPRQIEEKTGRKVNSANTCSKSRAKN